MNTYYTLLEYLQTLFESNNIVSTVITGNDTEIDNYKKNMFPLVHINVIDSPYVNQNTTALVRYNVEITCVDIRDISKENILDKFWLNDNRHDNLNTTRAILKLAQDEILKSNSNVTLFDSTTATPLVYEFENLLDGWQLTWTIDVNDELTNSCDDINIIEHFPNGTNDIAGDPLTEIQIIFDDNITLGAGNLELKYEGDFFGEWNENDMSVSNNVLTVDLGNDIPSLPTGDYYILFDSGLVVGFAGVTDVNELTFRIE